MPIDSLPTFVLRDQKRARWADTGRHTLASLALTLVTVALIAGTQLVCWFVQLPFALDDVFGFLIIGCASHSLGVLGHECYHDSFFRSKRTNSIVGAWLFHYPILGRFHHLKRLHLQHHRYFGTEEDPDIDHWGWNAGDRRHLIQIVKILSGFKFLSNLLQVVSRFSGSTSAANHPMSRSQMRQDIFGVLGSQLTIAVLFFFTTSATRYLFFWLLPIVTIGALVEHLRVFAEHNEGKLRVFTNPRTFEKVIFSRANFRLHALHHQSPSVPWFALGTRFLVVANRANTNLELSDSYKTQLKRIWN